ncbi:Putative uncharacterized protein [Taphrina deformans PYCC 5710]|uniref:t-SNARE coiled-coil homology domain-containing protein n=1 Tax=Taphrina deformans (strain PYCC 5710 / ATCC 11124 / CBS 356.35 / IMI 108563 / JCM 9778 / NBRC 8474) TaxID=1097556 RepID=R4X9C6_TAPDE|nr:Putative uncharacterized protein [Taphrina deformans PYCC 5710]|eukprot:CCG82336.1 Putative uncharacterized protein [Taphrina deformans PYCC 5710]
MNSLPPRWIDTTDEVDDLLRKIERLTKMLEPMHKKHALPGFEDRTAEEKEIERLTAQITSLFHKCSNLIKKVEKESKTGRDVDRIMCRNVTQAIAAKVSAENGKFRKGQSAYLARLRQRPSMNKQLPPEERRRSDGTDLEPGTSDVQAQSTAQRTRGGRYDSEINRREQEIDEIARSITEVADIFKELNTMVIDQGTMLDRIDYNIDNMHVNMQAASKELVKAENYQVRSRKRKLMLLLILLIVGAILVVIYKPIARHSVSSRLPMPGETIGSARLDTTFGDEIIRVASEDVE